MKTTIGKYPTWLGPYQLVEKLCFWAKKDNEYPQWVFDLGDKLAHSPAGGYISNAAEAYLQFQTARRVRVRIDAHDVWSMDHTLGYIVLPMLKQLKETKQGSPMIEDDDVPHLPKQGLSSNEGMQYDLFESDEYDELCWKQYEDRWDWVINEMIFAFESLVGENEDWEDKYWTNENYDSEGHTKEGERIQNGFRLFGKYYSGLWN